MGSCLAVILSLLFWPTVRAAENPLAIINGMVEKSEDAPAVGPEYRFQPGDYVFFSFGVAGFQIDSGREGQLRKIGLGYQITPEDSNGVALAPAVTGSIETELSPEDKNWTPKRRASFLLPSFIAAGEFQIHVVVKDLLAKTEISKSFPFRVGGVTVPPSKTVGILGLQFFRHESDYEPVELPAFAPGDSIFARFNMVGFQVGKDNTYHLAYGLVVLRPDGKTFLKQPVAADLEATSFYPAQYIPGDVAITTSRDTSKGAYILILTVRDLIGNTSQDARFTFTIE